MKFAVSNRGDKSVPWMSSFCLRFSRYMEERKAWSEVLSLYKHAVSLVWISMDLVRRLQKWMKSGNIKDGNATYMWKRHYVWKNSKAIAHFKGLF